MFKEVMIAVLLIGGVGLIAGVLLSVASNVFAVKVNEKEVKIREVLPGANCGSCGYSGCDGYAKALAEQSDIPTNLCRPGGASVALAVAEIMGVEAVETEKVAAFVRCGGDCQARKTLAEYEGIQSCAAAKMLGGGPSACIYGCLGCGDCEKVCEYDAIHVHNGVASVNREKCVACGMCVSACPNHLIELIPVKNEAVVKCSNKDKGGKTRLACTNGCIGCMKCQNNCPTGAITVVDNLARVDYSKCVACGVCEEGCPVHCIKLQ